jgi:hypothetical protein
MPELSDIQRDLLALAADLKRLEGDYGAFFAGRASRLPWETRARVEATIKRWGRGTIQGTGDRFRFEMLQVRFRSLANLWERSMRTKEEGRPSRLVHVTAFTDPAREQDKLHALYDTLMDARRQEGTEAVPFDSFATAVSSHVSRLQDDGSDAAAFRVVVKEGKVDLTVRGLKGDKG